MIARPASALLNWGVQLPFFGLSSAFCPLCRSSEDYPEIERLFPEAEVQYVPDAGHWVHADQPQQFLAALGNFLGQPPL